MPGINTAISMARQNTDLSPEEAYKNDIFISYSRKDVAFIKQLDAMFRRIGKDPWVDWDDIQKGEDWWKAIEMGIEGADVFVFTMSPDSLASQVCGQELEHAVKFNKRIIPIVRRDDFDMSLVHPVLASQNWLFFRETDNFEKSFQDLIVAIETDLSHVRAHTRILVKALEWESKHKQECFLLRGQDLSDAENWLVDGVEKKPKPTRLQADYIHQSRIAQSERIKAQLKARQIVAVTAVLANAAIAFAGYLVVNYATGRALHLIRENMIDTLNGALTGIDGDRFEDLANLPIRADGRPPIDEPMYEAHQDWLLTINRLEPRAYAYTYIRSENENEVLWIGDVYRTVRPEHATSFRETYEVPPDSNLDDGLSALTVTLNPYTDKWGTWISVYAPIRNRAGETVGGIGVDFSADYALDIKRTIRHSLILAYLVTFGCLLVLGAIILKVIFSLTHSAADNQDLINSPRPPFSRFL